jgi:hypothetical protein
VDVDGRDKLTASTAARTVSSGTPAGVGHRRTPPEYLQPGDVMESAIDAIGALRNKIVAVEHNS